MKKLVLGLVFMISACVGTTPQSTLYTLSAITSAPVIYENAKMFVGVGNVNVPVYLDRPQMVTRDKNQVELVVSELNRWSEPLGDAMQTALADDLAVYMPNAIIKPTSYRQENFDYVVWVEVNRFDGIWRKTADLSVWWSIFDGNGKLRAREKTDLQRKLGKRYEDLAIKDSELVGELAGIIAERLSKLK